MLWKFSVIFIFILNVQCEKKIKSEIREKSSDEEDEKKDRASHDRIIGGEEVKKGEE